jgi:hypothetical protein
MILKRCFAQILFHHWLSSVCCSDESRECAKPDEQKTRTSPLACGGKANCVFT